MTNAADLSTPQTLPEPAPKRRGPAFLQALQGIVRDPNPIFVKEIRTVFRMNLFAGFLGGSAFLIGLGMLLAGLVGMSEHAQPATMGRVLFHLYFGLALAVVTLVGPAFGASAITAEHEQRTYEALLLSGLSPARIVLGKFAAALASVGSVLVAFLPAVGIVFFFGGVTPLHVFFAYGELVLWLIPTLALGVALSARLRSTRIAIILSMLISAPATLAVVFALAGAVYAARNAWGVSMEGPFWPADALAMRPLSLDTLVYCVGCPAFLSLSLASFFLTTAIVALRGEVEDRGMPMKIWSLGFLACLPFFLAALSFLETSSDVEARAIALTASCGGPLLLYTFVFMNEPARALRRAPVFLRDKIAAFVGSGAGPTLRFAIATMLGFAAIVSAVPWAIGHISGAWDPRADSVAALLLLGHATYGFFLCAFGAWLRIRLKNGLAARMVVGAALFITFGAMWTLTILQEFGPPGGRHESIYTIPAATAFSLMEHQGWKPWAYFVPLGLAALAGLASWISVEKAHASAVHRARTRNPPASPS